MTHGSTFSGIGAPEVAAAMLGWENAFHCEINPFGRAVLDYYFPNAKSYEDITKTDFSEWRGRIDVLTGGFPCQPFSYAGKRRGSEDDRYLWPFMLRCIEQVQPTWFVGENVAGITTMAFPGEDVKVGDNADIFEPRNIYRREERYVLNEICESLERTGYEVQPILIPACAVGAPHRRDRVFIIARRNVADTDGGHDESGESGKVQGTEGKKRLRKRNDLREFEQPNNVRPTMQGNVRNADTECEGLERQNESRSGKTEKRLRLRGNSAGRRGPNGEGRTSSNTESEQGNGLRFEQRETRNQESSKLGRRNRKDGGQYETIDTNSPRQQDVNNGREMCGESRKTYFDNPGTNFNDNVLLPDNRWRTFPTVSPVYRGNDGLPFSVDDLTIPFSEWKRESLKAYGNAIVVQVMFEIFSAIQSISI